LNYDFLSQLKQLPSPIFGGDYYNHLGYLYHLQYGGSLLDNGQMNGEIPWVPWLYHAYVFVFSKIAGLDVMQGNIFSSIPLIFLTGIIMYFTMKRVTSNPILIITGALLVLKYYPVYKYTDFTYAMMGPLVLLAWMFYLEKEDVKRLLLLGVVLALANLTNTQLVFSSMILLGVVALDRLYSAYLKNREAVERKKFDEIWNLAFPVAKPFIAIFLVTWLLSMAYWYGPFFVERLKMPNDLQIYGWADFSQISVQIAYPISRLVEFYFPAYGATLASPFDLLPQLFSLLLLGGTYLVWTLRNEGVLNRFFFLILVAAMIALFHHLITFNLFHIQLAPERMFNMLILPLVPILVVFASDRLAQSAGKYVAGAGQYIPVIILILVAAPLWLGFQEMQKYNYVINAHSPLPTDMEELRQWINNNTGVYDVFLTDNEDGFMMNAISGRKVVSYRRTHAPTYADMNQRALDEAAILGGNNDSLRAELIGKYNVKYVLWTAWWFTNQIIIDQTGKITSLYDPLEVPARPEYKKYLEENNIPYITHYTYLDPAALKNYPKYWIYVIMPIYNYDKPWVPDFDRRLRLVKEIPQGSQQPMFRIYEINVEAA